uniref:Uncharacterized protein n=1 Tax=Oryza barthii TaxID=65489 RepID=A0A0D3GRN3_9ORYZ
MGLESSATFSGSSRRASAQPCAGLPAAAPAAPTACRLTAPLPASRHAAYTCKPLQQQQQQQQQSGPFHFQKN